jgi:hypothetical protein
MDTCPTCGSGVCVATGEKVTWICFLDRHADTVGADELDYNSEREVAYVVVLGADSRDDALRKAFADSYPLTGYPDAKAVAMPLSAFYAHGVAHVAMKSRTVYEFSVEDAA